MGIGQFSDDGVDGVFVVKDDVHKPYVIGQDENGMNITISGLKVARAAHPYLDREAMRVLRTMPWQRMQYALSQF